MNQAYTLTTVSFENVIKILFRPTFVLMIAALVCAAFSVISIILMHHWRTHGIDKVTMRHTAAIYFSGGFILVGVFIISVIQLLG